MAITEKDLVILPITKEMAVFSRYVAEKRTLFEYPRKGYGDYDKRGIAKIQVGVIGELAFLEYVFEKLRNKYGNLDALKRNEVLHKVVKFSYTATIGRFDDGFDFMLKDKTIDIKTYQTNKVTIQQIFNGLKSNGNPLSLFVDEKQNSIADIYIQAFILTDNRVCLAGFYEGLPPLQKWMPTPAHSCAVPQLNPLAKLIEF